LPSGVLFSASFFSAAKASSSFFCRARDQLEIDQRELSLADAVGW